ncbi:hypothetical protein HPB50_012899 [Hyalomma asiaticum]|uniref:Uncharacterized protein n=1 Tax=Hyalomma asiaticum TaxID=266040 RepID=A0ACB7TJM0_HYAAI|nr:hypothetical protein HPB50_012899 [Hyalomma asiaticum]
MKDQKIYWRTRTGPPRPERPLDEALGQGDPRTTQRTSCKFWSSSGRKLAPPAPHLERREDPAIIKTATSSRPSEDHADRLSGGQASINLRRHADQLSSQADRHQRREHRGNKSDTAADTTDSRVQGGEGVSFRGNLSKTAAVSIAKLGPGDLPRPERPLDEALGQGDPRTTQRTSCKFWSSSGRKLAPPAPHLERREDPAIIETATSSRPSEDHADRLSGGQASINLRRHADQLSSQADRHQRREHRGNKSDTAADTTDSRVQGRKTALSPPALAHAPGKTDSPAPSRWLARRFRRGQTTRGSYSEGDRRSA